MLDLGWSEILVIGVVALIVVGPKDLPKMLRTLGQYVGRAKGMARDFQRSMDDAARQADIEELKDVKKGLDDMRDAQHKMQRDLSQSFLDGPSKPAAKKPGAVSDNVKAKVEAAAVTAAATKPAKPAAKPKAVKGADKGSVSGA